MILFLDFDGVLHPAVDGEPTSAGEVFVHLPRFESVMREFPGVDIVISSSWRTQIPMPKILARFSPDIAARIVGSTPNLDAAPLARRENEILAWLAATGRGDEPWLALDDASWQFSVHLDRLVACTWYIGLDEKAAAGLRGSLSGMIAGA